MADLWKKIAEQSFKGRRRARPTIWFQRQLPWWRSQKVIAWTWNIKLFETTKEKSDPDFSNAIKLQRDVDTEKQRHDKDQGIEIYNLPCEQEYIILNTNKNNMQENPL